MEVAQGVTKVDAALAIDARDSHPIEARARVLEIFLKQSATK